MCLIVKSGCKIEIAKEPIIVKKAVFKDYQFLWLKLWEADVRHTIHRYNRILRGTRHLEINSNQQINQGFHACIKECTVLNNPGIDNRVRWAVIPKGAEYCLGEYNEIVANKMIVFNNKEKMKAYVSRS